MSLNIRKLSDELQKIACEELNEVPERIASDLASLREWLKQNKNLKSRDDDQFLVSFLRGCKYSLEKAKKKILLYYTARTSTPEFFQDRDTANHLIQEIVGQGLIMPLPADESKSNAKIVLSRLGHCDFTKFNFLQVMKATYLMSDMCMIHSDVTIVVGNINIVDLRGCGITLMSQITPQLIRKLSSLLEPFPVRIKAIHLVNPPRGIATVYNLFMSLCHEKLRNRVYVHDSFEDLHKVVDKRHLPVEYGGTNSNLPEIIKNWQKTLLENRQWFIDDVDYRIEGLPNNSSAADNGARGAMFGVEGSFRSLDID